MLLPRAVHECQGWQVAPGRCKQGSPAPVDVVPVYEGGPEPLDAHGPVVAEHEEGEEEEA